MFNARTIALAAALAVTGAAATAAPNASAKGGPGGVRVSGVCTKSATAELKLSRDDGRVEVEFEVDQNVNNRTWNVKVKHNGNVFWKGQRTTKAPSGSFSVTKRTANAAGTDTIVGRAVNPATGEVCVGSLSI